VQGRLGYIGTPKFILGIAHLHFTESVPDSRYEPQMLKVSYVECVEHCQVSCSF